MDIQLAPGKYVVAVSGGVDSVALLHVLRTVPDTELIVAHFDHGIRPDSGEDTLHVKYLARQYGLPFFYETGDLGSGTSEAAAREARYKFLRKIRQEQQADAIITAHHQDDVLETIIINMLRGTGRKGLSSLASRDNLKRPLLQVSKAGLLDYARQHNLVWREDSTNADEAYLRNYVRRQLLPRFDETARKELLHIANDSMLNNLRIDTLLVKYLPDPSAETMDRQQFISLPHDVAREVMAAWLRRRGVRDFDSLTLERLVVAGKTGRPGSRFDAVRLVVLAVGDDYLALLDTER